MERVAIESKLVEVLKVVLEDGINPLNEPDRVRAFIADGASNVKNYYHAAIIAATKSPEFVRAWQNYSLPDRIESASSLNGLQSWLVEQHGFHEDVAESTVTVWKAALGIGNEYSNTSRNSSSEKVFINTVTHADSSQGFLKKLTSGEYGIQKTFWIFGVLFSYIYCLVCYYIGMEIIFKDAINEDFSASEIIQNLLYLAIILYLVYLIPLMTGTWNTTKCNNKPVILSIFALGAEIAIALLLIFGGVSLTNGYIY